MSETEMTNAAAPRYERAQPATTVKSSSRTDHADRPQRTVVVRGTGRTLLLRYAPRHIKSDAPDTATP